MGDPDKAAIYQPTSREQAPFVVGDFITWSGTVLQGDRQGPGGTDSIAVNTVVASVGIFTEPGTLPVYIALGDFALSADAPRIFGGIIPQEPQNRLVLDAFVTDVTSIVDAYLIDVDPTTGVEQQRWVTPGGMTGGFGSMSAVGLFVDGGITTQLTGPVPGRVRMRAGKATPGILASPSRYIRVVARQLCDPINVNEPSSTAGPAIPCLKRMMAANGLFTGQYFAPVTDFIFPEVLNPGDPAVPNNLWDLGFLVLGEGPGTAPLTPTPW
jgi:hypothetical protein